MEYIKSVDRPSIINTKNKKEKNGNIAWKRGGGEEGSKDSERTKAFSCGF